MVLSDDDIERLARASSEAFLKLTMLSFLSGLLFGGVTVALVFELVR